MLSLHVPTVPAFWPVTTPSVYAIVTHTRVRDTSPACALLRAPRIARAPNPAEFPRARSMSLLSIAARLGSFSFRKLAFSHLNFKAKEKKKLKSYLVAIVGYRAIMLSFFRSIYNTCNVTSGSFRIYRQDSNLDTF